MSENLGLDDDFLEDMLGDFLDESDEIVSSLNENLLKLDEWVHSLDEGVTARCDDDLMNEMFRGAHSLKGLSGMLGLDNINTLTHKVENIFDAARNDKLALTGDVVDLVFQSVDKLTGMIDCLKDANAEPVDCEQVLSGIAQVLQNANVERTQVSSADAEQAFGEMQEADGDAELTGETGVASTLGLPKQEIDHFAEIVDETEVSAKYLAIFIDESEQALDDIADALLGEVSEKSTESLMIQCHKIKGSAASLGLHRATKLAHFMEDLLQELLQTKRELSSDMTEAMLRCTDALRNHVEGWRSGEAKSEGFNEAYTLLLASQLAAAGGTADQETPGEVEPATGATTSTGPAVGMTEAQREEVGALAPEGASSWIVQVVFEPGLPLPGLKASLAYGLMSSVGAVFYCDPPEEELDDLTKLRCLTIAVATEADQETIRSKVRLEGIERLEIEPLKVSEVSSPATVTATDDAAKAPSSTAQPSSPQAGQTKPGKQAAAKANKKPTETLRVDIERLDQLMNLAGQLIINKARFSQIGDGLKRLTASKQTNHSLSNIFGIIDRLSQDLDEESSTRKQQLNVDEFHSQAQRIRGFLEGVQHDVEQFSQARVMINDLAEAVHQLDRVADGIQKTVMDTRMVPIGPLFRRFKRVIRDITHGNGKDIQLVIRGENTELDKRMIDELGDPLIHMIRNCADHGIESPEVREAAGKPRQGIVTLDAFHRGNSILIEITDDGKGLDFEKIRNKAIEKGMLSAADAEKLSRQQILQLAWEPGLSTAEKVTEVSGRGMGMDIVRTKIEEINGSVELDSIVGEGTTITIKLPLTLAILPSLLVEIDGDVIAMPVEAVLEIVRVSDGDLSTVHGLATARVRDRVISVINLSELFCWNQPSTIQSAVESDEQSLVILGVDGVEIGLVVDELLGEEDIVIKSMAENYRNVDGIAGASILGDGRVSLILDVGTVLEMSANHDAARDTTKELVQ